MHHRRHGPVDSAGGQQPAAGHGRQQAGEGGAGVLPGLQPAAVYLPALQTQPLTQFCE